MPNAKARELRINMTDAERLLWSVLRDRQLAGDKFHRQFPIGPFIADFACRKHRLIIEADGGQHTENVSDQRRTNYLESQGWRVIRFWNNDILTDIEGVAEMILRELGKGG
jgi:very-short-patch-repair endonuclease